MQLPKNSYSALVSVLLAASASAAPHTHVAPAKRQYTELISTGLTVADKLLDMVASWMQDASDNNWIISRQIQGKATDFACIYGEHQVGPDWLENFVKPKCAEMTAAPEGSLVNNYFPNAMMSQSWPGKPGAKDGQWDGDWVDVHVAWSQIPNFNGEHAEMSIALCEEIVQYGMDICATGTPGRVEGFNVLHNREWAFNLDVTNIDDAAAEAAYGSG